MSIEEITSLPGFRVPFRPVDVDVLVEKFQSIIDDPVDISDIIDGRRLPFEASPRHCFDYEDGMRLGIARIHLDCGCQKVIARVFVIVRETPLFELYERGGIEAFVDLAVNRFNRLSGNTSQVQVRPCLASMFKLSYDLRICEKPQLPDDKEFDFRTT